MEFFVNPWFMAAGGVLVSSPIIIHLINRMRFKRLRWAAMEFLLKSQKRNRRRLIIEQLLLLLLRCLLIPLAALLLARFIGFTFGGFEQTGNVHVVVLDDSLILQDTVHGGDDAKEVGKLMLEIGKHKNVKFVYLVDCAHPRREPGQGGVPVYHDNLAIVEIRPNTRVASVGSTVFCTVTIANFSPRDAKVNVVPFNNEDGAEIKDKNYETPMPVTVPAGKTAQAVFS